MKIGTYNGKPKGASFDKQKGQWRSRIRIKGVSINLGLFDTQEEAHNAYVEAYGRKKMEELYVRQEESIALKVAEKEYREAKKRYKEALEKFSEIL